MVSDGRRLGKRLCWVPFVFYNSDETGTTNQFTGRIGKLKIVFLIQGDSDLANDFLVSLNSRRIKTADSQLNNLFNTNFRMQRMARTN